MHLIIALFRERMLDGRALLLAVLPRIVMIDYSSR